MPKKKATALPTLPVFTEAEGSVTTKEKIPPAKARDLVLRINDLTERIVQSTVNVSEASATRSELVRELRDGGYRRVTLDNVVYAPGRKGDTWFLRKDPSAKLD